MLMLFCRHSTLKTLQMAKPFNLIQQPYTIQTRHFGNSYAELIIQYTMTYSENSLLARAFVYTYQAIGSVSYFDCTGGVIATALACRLLTFPLFALSEKLVSKRMIANQLIKKQEAAAYYGEKAIMDQNTGRMTFAQPTRILTNLESRKRMLMLDKVEQLCYKTQYEYSVENKLQLHRILCLKIGTFPLWMHTAIALRTSIDCSQQFWSIYWIFVGPNFCSARSLT
ncbi:hypothetical protein Mgra_00004558 [Meloidogyne graminicola]|uniref:Uncharacterized protein n=1 Tax=Meloidogyne graminicola TaxID=189291 RepID=A0A8S9ZQU6_9BILA|nr:hypothetical protein Mgra_00004558 [Meloidogyne graminicola]